MGPRVVTVLRAIGGVAMIAGGAAWSVTFIWFATEHPGLDSWLWVRPLLSVAVLGGGMLLAMPGRWAPVSRGTTRVGAALLATGAAGCAIILAVPALLTFLAGSVLPGAGLGRTPRTRLPGFLIGFATGLFVVTRPWMLGRVQTGDALATQEVVEKVLAISLGVSWAIPGITCVRVDERTGAGWGADRGRTGRVTPALHRSAPGGPPALRGRRDGALRPRRPDGVAAVIRTAPPPR